MEYIMKNSDHTYKNTIRNLLDSLRTLEEQSALSKNQEKALELTMDLIGDVEFLKKSCPACGSSDVHKKDENTETTCRVCHYEF